MLLCGFGKEHKKITNNKQIQVLGISVKMGRKDGNRLNNNQQKVKEN
jgi:hypothetical protein